MGSQTEETRKFIIGIFADIASKGWAEGFGPAIAPECVFTIKGSYPFSGTYNGAAAYASHLQAKIVPLIEEMGAPQVTKIIADGETAAVEWRGVGGKLKSGSPYEVGYAWFFTLREGKIVELVEYFDDAGEGGLRELAEILNKGSQ